MWSGGERNIEGMLQFTVAAKPPRSISGGYTLPCSHRLALSCRHTSNTSVLFFNEIEHFKDSDFFGKVVAL